jgi:hypothetical protein
MNFNILLMKGEINSMSKYLSDWDLNFGGGSNCSKCHSPSCQEPIDININVNCCCPEPPPPPASSDCCCNGGMSKALDFIRNNIQDAADPDSLPQVDIFGINSSPLAGNAIILDPDPTDVGNIDIVKVRDQSDGPNEFRYISTCAIYYIGIKLNPNSDIDLNAVIEQLQEEFTLQDNPDCCCKDTIARKLNELRIAGTCVSLDLNNQTPESSDVDGAIIALDADVVWIDDDAVPPRNYDLIVTSICYIAMIKPEGCSIP